MIALQTAIIKLRTSRTVPRNSLAYNPQSNGSAEKGVQDVTDLIRRHVLALQARLQQTVNLKTPVMAWLIRHAAFVLTRYSVGHDGLTPWRRLTGKCWNGVMAEFGEQVMAKLALKKPPTDKKAKKTKKKLAPRSIPATWLGIYERTGEHLVATRRGDVIRVRTIHRLPKEDQWNADAVFAVRALPRKPNPEKGSREPEPKLAQDKAEDEERVNIERPDHEDRRGVPRELRITERLLDKVGLTTGCPGCMHKQAYADGKRPHNDECRKRIYDEMMKDDDELDRMIQVDARMGRAVPKAERVRRAKVDEADDLNNPKDMEEQKDTDHGGVS